jgi:site-specific recombinase XerC
VKCSVFKATLSIVIGLILGLLKDLQSEHIREDVRQLTPWAASNGVKAWRAMLRFAVDESLVSNNPARDVSAPKSISTSHHQWAPTKD